MKLEKLLENICSDNIPSRFREMDIEGISCDSRTVEGNDIFVAIKGATRDGANFISEAIAKGASVIIKNHHAKITEDKNICVLSVHDPKKVLLDISQRFYDYPSKKVKTIGITGTNGKTTVLYLLESILHRALKRCAVIGTVNYRIEKEVIPSKNTTPGLLDNQRYLAEMAKKDIEYCLMEVSSHALDQGRVDAIDFRSAVFTNLTSDHMDYHQNIRNYFETKSKLFISLLKESSAIINTDDAYGRKLISMTKAKILTYALQDKADVTASGIDLNLDGSVFTLQHPDGKIGLRTKLIGRHNIYNILAASAACVAEKIPLKNIKEGIESLNYVPGRLEQIDCGQDFSIFVDYAHTEDALKNVLSSLKNIEKSKIILVFGCGGDRDKTKRPKMGKVASQWAGFTILTSDNPRSEESSSIVEEILSGYQGKNYEVILDRKEAIDKALSLAGKGDIVLIAGKGHEDYQVFKNKTIHFDDRKIVRSYFGC